jgi:hypothetical protein
MGLSRLPRKAYIKLLLTVCDGAALSVEVASLDIDELGTPYIDDANPNTAGKIWIK